MQGFYDVLDLLLKYSINEIQYSFKLRKNRILFTVVSKLNEFVIIFRK